MNSPHFDFAISRGIRRASCTFSVCSRIKMVLLKGACRGPRGLNSRLLRVRTLDRNTSLGVYEISCSSYQADV